MGKKIAIIGSGFLGLTLALRCSKAGFDVTVFESGAEIGGLASAWQIGDVVWDKHYHVTLLSDSYTRRIVEEIGLGDEFEWVETKTGFFADGNLYSMSNTIEFLTFPPLGLIGKLRLAATIFYASRIADWRRLEGLSVEEWLTGLSGKRTFDRIWRPLLLAKLGKAYSETSAAFIWATIQRLYAARRSGLKKELFGYVKGGYSRVLSRIESVLKVSGVDIRLNSQVDSVERAHDGQIAVSSSGSPVSHFDRVVLTCPSGAAGKIVKQLNATERSKLEAIRYQGIVCASVLLKRSLSPYYVTNIIDETPFTGIIEMTALVPKEDMGGNALVYLPKYVAPDDEIFETPDSQLQERFIAGLESMYPSFSRDDVIEFKLSRVRQVFPVPVLNYSRTVPDKETSVENVYIVNSAHILNGTLNVNETVQLAESFFAEYLSVSG